MTAYFSMWGMNASATEAFKVAPYTMVAALKVQILNNWKCKFNTFFTIKSLVGICHFNLELFLLKSAFHLSLQRKTVQGWWQNTSVRVSPVFENIRKILAFDRFWPLKESGQGWVDLEAIRWWSICARSWMEQTHDIYAPTRNRHWGGLIFQNNFDKVRYFKRILTKLNISKRCWQS